MTTKSVTGAWWTAPLSNNIDRGARSGWRLLVYLAALGAAGVALHAGFRWPLHLPGHHGLEWMALLAFARVTASRRWSASAVGLAAAGVALAPAWGFHDPFAPLAYLLAGVLLDGLCLAGERVPRGVVLPVGAALAFTASGLVTFLSAFHPGVGLWLAGHLGFGLLGGLMGTWLGAQTRRALAGKQRRL